ncbi:MAG: mechanosensitive ion channel domain-containing protein [Planctomycetota bacterium]
MRCRHRAIIVCIALLGMVGLDPGRLCIAQLNLIPSSGPQAPGVSPANPSSPGATPPGGLPNVQAPIHLPPPIGTAPTGLLPNGTPPQSGGTPGVTGPPTPVIGPSDTAIPSGTRPATAWPPSIAPSTKPPSVNSQGNGLRVNSGPMPNAVRDPSSRPTVRALMASRSSALGSADTQDTQTNSPSNDGPIPNATPAAQNPTTPPDNPNAPASNGNGTAQGSPAGPPSSKDVAPDSSALSVENVQAQWKQIQTATDLDATIRQTLTTIYEAILAEAKKRLEDEKALKDFGTTYEAAPNATSDAKKRKEAPAFRSTYAEGTLPLFRIESLQALQLETSALFQAATKGRTDTETTIASREARKKEMPRYISEAKGSIAKLSEELAVPAAEGVDPRVRDANQLLTRSKLAAANTQLRRLELEQRTFDAEAELLPLRKELFIAEEKYYQLRLKEISDELSKRRENQIAMQKRLAEDLKTQSKPGLDADANRIVKRTEDWLTLVKEHASLRMKIDQAKSLEKQWSDRYKIMTDRLGRDRANESATDRAITVSRLKSLVGEMLRRQRNELPNIEELNRSLEDYRSKIESTQSIMLSLDDWKAENASTIDPTRTPLNLENSLENFANLNVTEQHQVLDATERHIVDEFRLDASNCSETLFNLAVHNQALIDQVRKYRDFIDEHILWIRSTDPFGKNDWNNLWRSVQELLDLRRWSPIPKILLSDIGDHVGGYGLAVFGLLLLLLYTRQMRKEMHQLGITAVKSNTTSMSPTLKSIVLCVLLSAPMALIHILLGWRLVHSSGSNQFIESVGMGLLVGARYFFPLEMLRQISRSGGLAESHFQWSTHASTVLRRHLRWCIDLSIPTVCLVGLIWNFSETRWENSLGRIAFSVLMILCSAFMLNVLHPRHGVFRDYLERNAGGWIDRLSFLWYSGLSFAPVVLMVMSLMGYHYTAIRLSMHLHTSCMTLVGLLLLYNLICRWLLLRRRQLIVSQARQRLEEARRRDADTPSMATAVAPIPLETEADLSSINAQTIRLVSSTLVFAAFAAIAFIWSSILPAVGVLDSIQLWTVGGSTPDEKIPVTLANLLFAIPAAIMTVVAAKNLPGLLEIALLQHLPIENAVRYAITSISRYAIFVLGIAMTFNSLGVRWASIQWLVAALGVGLGFGLQEIFANFVSGLILLFEQPIRVGDVITVGDTTGTVSKIRMRATTVMNFDQQELVIPNKDLVTGRLLNWTLSDSTNRLIIEVGVAYGTDTEKACAILREICSCHPNVLKLPEPTAFFELFADSTLQLKARLFLASLDLRLPTRHELLTSIHHRFAQENIELSFPQRDIHIRSMPDSSALGIRKAA